MSFLLRPKITRIIIYDQVSDTVFSDCRWDSCDPSEDVQLINRKQIIDNVTPLDTIRLVKMSQSLKQFSSNTDDGHVNQAEFSNTGCDFTVDTFDHDFSGIPATDYYERINSTSSSRSSNNNNPALPNISANLIETTGDSRKKSLFYVELKRKVFIMIKVDFDLTSINGRPVSSSNVNNTANNNIVINIQKDDEYKLRFDQCLFVSLEKKTLLDQIIHQYGLAKLFQCLTFDGSLSKVIDFIDKRRAFVTTLPKGRANYTHYEYESIVYSKKRVLELRSKMQEIINAINFEDSNYLIIEQTFQPIEVQTQNSVSGRQHSGNSSLSSASLQSSAGLANSGNINNNKGELKN